MSVDFIKIEVAYKDYTPTADYVSLVREMLAVVPPACLDGIERIELRAGSPGNRAHRRKKIRSHGRRKHFRRDSLGLYYPGGQTHAPHIVLHVDNLDRSRAYIPRIPLVRWFLGETRIAETLFHEIGHHIHLVKQRTYRDKENVADDWADFYTKRFVRAKFWWLRIVLFPVLLTYSLVERVFLPERREKRLTKRRKRKTLRAVEAEIVAAYNGEV